MRLAPLIFGLFVAIPIVEIWLLIEVGGFIGVLPTIALVVLTAVAGTALIRHQGVGILNDARQRLDRGEPPVSTVVDGAFLLVAGALLLTPGFVTDAIGFLCLVPGFRRLAAAWLWARFGDRIIIHGQQARGQPQDRGHPHTGRNGPRTGQIIEGEFEEVSEPREIKPGPPRDDSPWRGSRPN